PRTYWEAYLAILLGKRLGWIWHVAEEDGVKHPKPEGREHYQIMSDSGWDRCNLPENEFNAAEIALRIVDGRCIRKRNAYSSLIKAQALSANYIPRPAYEKDICDWLKAASSGRKNPHHTKLLSVSGGAG